MGSPGRLAAPVRTCGGSGRHPRRTRHRRHAHQGASLREWRKKGEAAQAIGRSRGGRTSKVHALADAHGRPIAFTLTPGNVADIAIAPVLLDTVDPPRRLLADKAYDTDAFRAWLRKRAVEAVIPSTLRRKRPCAWDQEAYRRRNLIERMFCRMKDWRRMATRYDRLARNYLSALALVAVVCFWSN
jgi:transposase